MMGEGKSGVRLETCCLKTIDCNSMIFKLGKQQVYLKYQLFLFTNYFKASSEGFNVLKQVRV